MSEYVLHDATIERCQICNAVWLDPTELEKMMTLMPDIRKSYEEGERKIELNGAMVNAVAVSAGMMIDNSHRKMLDNSPLGKRLGPFIFFFYP
jgi:Zn-finger nucleic acid-binding protein